MRLGSVPSLVRREPSGEAGLMVARVRRFRPEKFFNGVKWVASSTISSFASGESGALDVIAEKRCSRRDC